MESHTFPPSNVATDREMRKSDRKNVSGFWSIAKTLVAVLAVLAAATGCGSGGYVGGGIASLSSSSLVLDAGQSAPITAKTTGSLNVAWAFPQQSCGNACGTLSTSTGTTVTYTAPSGITSAMKLTLVASIPRTRDSETVSITVNPEPVLTATLPEGLVGSPYTGTLSAAAGTAPYTFSVASGTLPAGLTLNSTTGAITGTPSTVGTSTFAVQLTDSSSVPDTVTANETITVIGSGSPLNVTGGTQPGGQVGSAYSTSFVASGGVTPYTWAIVSGSVPAGLSMSASTSVISGTPTTAGTSNFTIQVQDSTGATATAAASITINANSGGQLAITSTLPNGTVGVVYSAAIAATGGTAPYSCSITGNLPTGLALANCTVSGTPTVAGSWPVTVKVTDTSNPAQSVSSNQSITINPAALVISSTLRTGTVGSIYSSTITASGGTPPYSCSISSGTLPAGLSLIGCTVSGTPASPGSSTVTISVTDSGNPAQTATSTQTITINPAQLTLTASSLPDGTVGVPYAAVIGVSGGTSPYGCTITSGILPAGLSISGCTVSGTPTTAGAATVNVKVTDGGNPQQTASGPETITIHAASLTLTSTFPTGTVGITYSATITASGGTTPYTCSIPPGTLPAGLTLSGCVVSGTPSASGSTTVAVTVTDASQPARSVSVNQTIVINASGALSLTGTPPSAIQGTPYSYTFQAVGGTQPYSYAITAGSVPAGLTLQANGVLSGTPTTPGASSFTVTVTDSAAPQGTASLAVVLLVKYPSAPNDGELDGPYAFLFQGYDDVVAGVLAYQTATIGSFTADGTGGISLGELDANHQSSNPNGTTVDSQNFLGTYEVNADNRGFITITTLNADGTTNQTFTYAISLKAPASPATTSTQGSLIEYDNDNLVGTKGAGTLLAQTTSAFAAGLNGSYAFGLSGDTPCLISCTVGIASGPVATVGVFTGDGASNLSSGLADANIASTNFAQASLTGSYETADQNGRIQLEITNVKISDGLFPTDFAAYVVNANEVLIMSVDRHADYTLLAGTAQLQTQASFSDASMNAAFIGYENAQSNPGLLGTTLQDVLNFSTATAFRASGNGSGSCNTTNVDSGGLTSLVDNLTGLSNSQQNNLIEALLGSYGATGTASCAVTSNGRAEFDYPAHSGVISILLGLLGLPTGAPPARVVYLVSPNQGYFLETGYAGLGHIEAQTAAPFSVSTLDGKYVEGTLPAASLASITTSGYLRANGNGTATYTYDENVGVGTLNVLQLGTSGTTTYSLADPNNNVTPATAGRYVLADGTTVLYAISAEKFVLVDTNPLTTSPSVSLLY